MQVKKMRIIAGKHRGRRLKAVPGQTTRPTADRVKEAVFSAISDKLPGCCFLDVFSGTGSMALEALSRGAAKAVLIEKDGNALKVIRDNLAVCHEEANATIISKEASQALKTLVLLNKSFDIVYIDPPYQGGLYEKTLDILAKGQLLADDGIILCESAKNTSLMPGNSIFCIYKERFYGDTKITFLHKPQKSEEEQG